MSETNGSNPRREILRLETDVPVVASLLFDDGRPVEGRYGDQVMFTIATDGGERVLYVDPHVSQMFTDLRLRRGEPFRIGKFIRKDGNRRGLEWKVSRLEPEEMAPAVESAGAAPPPPASENGTAYQHQAADTPVREPDVPQPITPAPAPAPSSPPRPTPPANPPAAAAPAPHTGPRPHTSIPFAGRQDGQYLLSALVNMIDMCAAAEHYAGAKGMEIHFAAEDVRALAITAFIQATRGGGVR